jgi:hypothetical protein
VAVALRLLRRQVREYVAIHGSNTHCGESFVVWIQKTAERPVLRTAGAKSPAKM